MSMHAPGHPIVRLGEVVQSISAGLSIAGSGERAGTSEPGVLTLSAVSTGRFCPDEARAIPPVQAARYSVFARQNTVLISRSNTLDLVGAAVYVDVNYPHRFLSDLIWEIRTDSNSLSPRYLVAYLQSPIGRRHLCAAASGTSGSMKKISMGRLRAIPIALPNLDTQEHLADVDQAMSQVDEDLNRLIGAKRRLRDGLAQALLTGRRRLPAFAGRESRAVRIGEHLTESREPGSHGGSARKLTVRLYGKGVIPKQNGKGGSAKTRYYTRRAGQLIYSKLDFLNGAFGLVPRELDGWESTLDLPAFDIDDSIDPRFLRGLCVLPSFYRSQIGLARGGRKARRVPPEDFLSIKIRLPERDEQSAIADILDAATREIDALTRLREAVAKQKRGLMQQLLTGRLRVPEVSDAV